MPMNNFPEAPKPPCAVYATALPELRAGMLSQHEKQSLRDHLRDCAVCREQAEAGTTHVIEDAVLRHYGVPTTAAPFLTLDDIRHRMALVELDGLNTNHTPIHLYDRGITMQKEHEPQAESAQTALPSFLQRYTPPPRELSAGRWHTGAAVAAVVGLIAVFALVVHSFAGEWHIPNKVATHNQPGAWTRVTQFSTHESALQTSTVIVGISNPNVIYELSIKRSLTFHRSDDGGKTWHNLTFPTEQVGTSKVAASKLYINPLDAQMVWANLIVGPEDPNCHNTNGCTFSYASTNGGTTWMPQTLPDGLVIGFGPLGGLSGAANGVIYAQGQRLYTELSSSNPDPSQSHLATSLDGIHWSIIDNLLTSQHLVIIEFAVTPTGSTIFATTARQSAAFSLTNGREFWRSDDAGAHWTDLGEVPHDYTHLLGAATVNGTKVVYYGSQGSQENSYGAIKPDEVVASANNGKTWQKAPTANALGGLQVGNAIFIGMLGNGSIILLFDKTVSPATRIADQQVTVEAAATYSWQPGEQRWAQISQDLKMSSDSSYDGPWYTPAFEGVPAKLWELTLTSDQSNYILWSCPLS